MSSVLLVKSPDEVGLINRITGVLLRGDLNVVANAEYVDRETNWFFMRTEFDGEMGEERIAGELARVLPARSEVRLVRPIRKRLVIFTGKEPFCLGDLLLRWWNGELPVEIPGVISNHRDQEALVQKFGIPFHFVPVRESAGGTESSRKEHEQEILKILQPRAPDLLVLAKYMRVLTPEFAGRYSNRIVNIHHSFLPAFVGANPYRQAYQRGVKLIGATAHFVNEGLDEGPIIAQSVLPVTHADSSAAMALQGREIEKVVLARALQLMLEDRVFVHQGRTVIFE